MKFKPNAAPAQPDIPDSQDPIILPSTASTTPTVSELLNAANWEYDQVGQPSDLQPFLLNGRQLTAFNQADGFSAAAWLTPANQVVVSYEGTQAISALSALANPLFSVEEVLQDAGIASGAVTSAEKDAAIFARYVTQQAATHGINASSVFLTGHSLGGIEAEYAAQQTGLGGIAFESTGIPRSSTAAGTGSNFVNVVTYGDPVASYASDVRGEQPFAPPYAPGGTGTLPHYGQVAFIGDPADQSLLTLGAQPSRLGPTGAPVSTLLYAPELAVFHVPSTQAHDLGVTLTQHPAADEIVDPTGPVLWAANDTIPQFITATGAQLSAATPPAPGEHPGQGGQAAAALQGSGPLAAQLLPALASDNPAVLGSLLQHYGLTATEAGTFTAILTQQQVPSALQTILQQVATITTILPTPS